jgi:hypothetical protein
MSNETKQTAVEWLEEQLPIYGYNVVTVFPELIEQAKEMEKEQIMDAFDECGNWHHNYLDSEQWYNETY